jgi:hypothetical protein
MLGFMGERGKGETATGFLGYNNQTHAGPREILVSHGVNLTGRITPNLFTTLPELDRFCEVMDGSARKGLPG